MDITDVCTGAADICDGQPGPDGDVAGSAEAEGVVPVEDLEVACEGVLEAGDVVEQDVCRVEAGAEGVGA